MTKLYLSGPMTGLPDFNRAAFDEARPILQAHEYEVVDPVSEDIRVYGSWEEATKHSWKEHLARDVAIVPTCDVLALLPGWETSRGANLELRVARTFGLEVYEVEVHGEGNAAILHMTAVHDPDPGTGWAGDVAAPPPLEATERSRASTGASIVADVSGTPYEGDRFVSYEEDPKRHVYVTGGIKDNRGKPRLDLIPSAPLIAIGEVLEAGAKKYREWNWARGLPWDDTFASLQRHLWAWHDGQDTDPETGLPHLAHAGCQIMFLLTFVLKDIGEDDRWKYEAPSEPSA